MQTRADHPDSYALTDMPAVAVLIFDQLNSIAFAEGKVYLTGHAAVWDDTSSHSGAVVRLVA